MMRVLVILLVLYVLLYLRENERGSFESGDHVGLRFSVDDAYSHLIKLSHEQKGIGERHFSSRQCSDAHLWLVEYLKDLKTKFTNGDHFDFVIDEQNVSSDVMSTVLSYRGMRRYSNVTNVIALFMPKNETFHNEILLVNSHFDSGLSSPGTFDDGVPVVVMMEHVRSLMNEQSLKHPVLFLFNGAEEMGLYGAHAFMKYSKYAKDISAFINLESAGFGGRDFVFQSTNAWMMQQYAKVIKYPYGNSVGQDVFQAGIIPSDTDYRYFWDLRQQGIMHGVDSAFIGNGHWYHSYLDSLTMNDASEKDIKKSLRYMGENSLRLLLSLALMDAHYDNSTLASTKATYFDLLNFVMVAYDVESAQKWYFGIIAIAIPTLIGQLIRRRISIVALMLSIFTTLLVAVASLLGSLATAHLFVRVLNAQLSWYSATSDMILLFYGLPAITLGLVAYFAISVVLGRHISQKSLMSSSLVFWAALLGVGAYFKLGSSYLVACSVASLLLGECFSLFEPLQMILSVALPSLNYLALGRTLCQSFSGILGRSGSKPVDYTMASLVGLSSTLMLITMLPFSRLNRANTALSLFIPLFILTGGLMYMNYLSEPYSRLQPKRLSLRHVYVYDERDALQESYLNLKGMDPIPPEYVFNSISYFDHGFNYTTKHKSHAIPNLGGRGLTDPIYYKVTSEELPHSFLKPKVSIQREQVDQDTDRVAVEIHSSKYLFNQRVFVHTDEPSDIVKWSFYNESPVYSEEDKSFTWDMVFGYNRYNTESENEDGTKVQSFSMNLKRKGSVKLQVLSHYADRNVRTASISTTLEILPEWTATIPVVTIDQTYLVQS